MKIFVVGATGAIGKRLLPVLVANGNEVVGTTRSAQRADQIRAMGAEPAVVDVLDRNAVMAAVMRAEPEVIVHQATALTGVSSFRNLDKTFEMTNRLRTQGTDNLLEAARAAGTRRFVAQSFAGWPFEQTGGPVKTEEDPLDPNPIKTGRQTIAAIKHVESKVTGAPGIEGLVLRYGGFYGPGTSLAEGADYYEAIKRRRLPIVGSGAGVWSFIHMDDAAGATLAAIEGGPPGIFNIADDEPAPVSEWLPEMAKIIGAKPPRRVPKWLGRILAGEAMVILMTEVRGASNAKAKRELGWQPIWPSWRDGFRRGLADTPQKSNPAQRVAR
jgi:nucleoside-diphosphate-sugar epimerase